MSENIITIECWKCEEDFEKAIPKKDRVGVVLVICPFCGAECKVEFDNSSVITLFKSKKG